jgi:hypothetical protein
MTTVLVRWSKDCVLASFGCAVCWQALFNVMRKYNSIKYTRISCLAMQLLASREGFFSMKSGELP